MFIVSCRVCGVEFKAKTNRRVYCTKRCNDEGKPSAQGLTCCICNGPMRRGRSSQAQGVAAHDACRVGVPEAKPHGTMPRYRCGCRCALCREANTAANREYRERYKATHGLSPRASSNRKFKDEHGYWPQRLGDWISITDRIALYERDNYTCWLCHEAVDMSADPKSGNRAPSLDHVVPQSKGGTHEHSNLRTACRRCNSIRSDSGAMSLEAMLVSA